MFDDAELNRLETLALTNNQNLAAAAARFEQARDLAAAARSEFYPQLTAGGTPGGDVNRQRTSVNEPQNGQPAGAAHTYDTFTAPIYLGWEMDLWGRVRRQSEAAHARSVASADDLESAKLDVAAEVADDYFIARTLDEEYDLVANTIEAYQRSLELTQNRRRGGVVSDLDVAQAATQLHTAEAQLPDIQLRRAQTLHALAIFCGQSPVDFSIATNATAGASVPEIPPSLPSELLEHRPDIAAAERRMAAANADIGVAKAAFFPAIRINGLAGFQSIDSSSWFNWPSRFWSVGPSVRIAAVHRRFEPRETRRRPRRLQRNGCRLSPDGVERFRRSGGRTGRATSAGRRNGTRKTRRWPPRATRWRSPTTVTKPAW